jgi:transcriptional regulator with XRE-family HTH domain
VIDDNAYMVTARLTRVAAANIRRLAKSRRIALAHLADRAGIGRTTLWRLLDTNAKGPSDPRLSTLVALAAVLGVEVAELLVEH